MLNKKDRGKADEKTKLIIGYLLYIFAGLLFIYSLWSFSHCRGYIKDAIRAGQLAVEGNEYDIMNFYMSNCVIYFINAILLFSLGWISLMLPNPNSFVKLPTAQLPISYKKEDEELDQWFEEIQTNQKSQE
jgi:hypothetical protein